MGAVKFNVSPPLIKGPQIDQMEDPIWGMLKSRVETCQMYGVLIPREWDSVVGPTY